MKKLLFVLLILSVVTSYAQIPSYVPTNGLVGYWPFNGNANDESGNGNNGTVNGATLTSDRFGNANSAYLFSGTQTINVPHNNSLNLKSNYAISLWYLPTDVPNPAVDILIKGANDFTGRPYYLRHHGASNANQGFAFRHATGTYPGSPSIEITSELPSLNNWHHVLINIVDSLASFYVDGIKKDTTFFRGFQNIINNESLKIGGGYYQFNGKIDDIGFYNRALSQSEITGLYNAGTNTCLPSYLPTTGLVGYWPFCGNANDESGNGNNGTVNGATLTTDGFGNGNSSYYFDGNNFTHIAIPNNPNNSLNLIQDLTISSWFYANTMNDYNSTVRSILMKSGDGVGTPNGYTYGVWAGTPNSTPTKGTVNFQAQPNNNSLTYPAGTSGDVLINKWYNFIVTYTKNDSILKYFINGILIDTKQIFFNIGINSNELWIGSQPSIYSATKTFKGKLDDIGIWNRALSPQEISQLYYSSAPCIANITSNDTTICKGSSVTLNAAAVTPAAATDINGNTYPSVNIGSQTWMQKNLNVSKYKNGDIIPQVTDPTQWYNLTTGAWCWYNNDSATYAATYGKLYNWYAVNDSRVLAPDGWHVASDMEWNKLIFLLDNTADTICQDCSQSILAGGALKEIGTSHWISPNFGATNLSGFKALPGGARDFVPSFNYVGYVGIWWTSTPFAPSSAINKRMYYGNSNIERQGQTQSARGRNDGYSVRALRNTSTYLWSTGATTPSITVSPLVTTTYYCTVSDGVNTCRDSVKITVGATAIPSTPASITGAADVCGYFSSITSATSNAVTYTAATVSTASSYIWTVPAGVTIVSGQGTNSITVTFAYSFVSGAIAVNSVNVCGASTAARSLTVYKRVASTPAAIQKEFSPTSIAAVTNVTGLVSETYRIKKVLYATSYNWYMNRGTNATITHINPLGVNDTAVIVTFVNCFVRDTLSVKSVAPCSVSTAKTAILIANTVPASVAGIGTVGGDFAVCIGTTKTFNAIAGTPTTSQAPIASFRWTKPTNTVITSATSDSSSITVSFGTGFTGGSLTAKGVTACGVIGTTAVSAILQYLPPTALSISSSTAIYNACINSSVTYTAIVGAPTTSQTPTSVFRWTRPNNTTVTAASADSSSITVRFNTGYVGGTLSVRGQSRCGTLGVTKSQALTHTGCAVGTKMSVPVTTETNINSFEVSLYPNPSAGEFKLLVNLVGGKTPTMTKAIVKVIDLQGRLIKSFECNANQPTAIGNELKPGVYMVEVRIGNEVKTVRAVRF